MNVTSQIKQPIFKEMELLKKKFNDQYSQVALLNREYLLYSESKRQTNASYVRFLTAKMVSAGT
jgi:octaprenyl-diphosphate synthase